MLPSPDKINESQVDGKSGKHLGLFTSFGFSVPSSRTHVFFHYSTKTFHKMSTGENLIEQLKNSVTNFVSKTGSENSVARELLAKLDALQQKLNSLSGGEKLQFLTDMKDSFLQIIGKVESKLAQHEQLQNAFNYSKLAAIIFSLIAVFALFGYKLYKSLMAKEQKKQEKLKGKQSKKTKKTK